MDLQVTWRELDRPPQHVFQKHDGGAGLADIQAAAIRVAMS